MSRLPDSKTIGLAIRGVYLVIIAICIATGKPQHALAFSVPFLITLPIAFAARKDQNYAYADIMFMELFLFAMLLSYFDMWPATSTAYTLDKPFHILAGACLANLMRIYLLKKFNDRRAYYLCIIACTLAVGAGWEVFEWTLSKLPALYMTPSTGYDDTMMDLVADMIGALIIVAYYLCKAWRKKEQTWVEI